MSILLTLLFSFSAMASSNESIVPFYLKAETCVSQEELWEQLETSMIDSNQTWVWPNHLSEVNGEGIYVDSKIDVTYKWYYFTNTYSYEIVEVTEGTQFSYRSIEGEHAFAGGATISILVEDGRTYLVWDGSYTVQKNQWLQKVLFNLYTKRLFRTVKKTLRQSCT